MGTSFRKEKTSFRKEGKTRLTTVVSPERVSVSLYKGKLPTHSPVLSFNQLWLQGHSPLSFLNRSLLSYLCRDKTLATFPHTETTIIQVGIHYYMTEWRSSPVSV